MYLVRWITRLFFSNHLSTYSIIIRSCCGAHDTLNITVMWGNRILNPRHVSRSVLRTRDVEQIRNLCKNELASRGDRPFLPLQETQCLPEEIDVDDTWGGKRDVLQELTQLFCLRGKDEDFILDAAVVKIGMCTPGVRDVCEAFAHQQHSL